MGGPLIAVVTAIVLLGAAFIIAYIPRIFRWIKDYFDRCGLVGKILILLPLIILGVMSIFSWAIAFVIMIATAFYAINGLRDWWHKSK